MTEAVQGTTRKGWGGEGAPETSAGALYIARRVGRKGWAAPASNSPLVPRGTPLLHAHSTFPGQTSSPIPPHPHPGAS